MTLQGHIKNGAIVLDQPQELPEGAAVQVEVLEPGVKPEPLDGPTLLDRLRACLHISKLDRDDSPLPCQSPHFADKTEVKSFGRACFHGPNLNLKTPS